MTSAASAFFAAFALVSLVAGLCCHRVKAALIAGALIGVVCAGLVLAAVLSSNPNILDSEGAGRLVGNAMGCVLVALLGWGIRRGVSALSRGRPDKAAQTPK
jgi:hypothetical protein